MTRTPRLTALAAAAATATAALLTAVVPAAQAATVLSGPDVSGYQHPGGAAINWGAVKAGGNSFAIIKATEGTSFTNRYYAADAAGARRAGLVVGAYAFARPMLPMSTATAQAKHLTDVIGGVSTRGTLPPVLDLEESGGLSQADLTTWTQTFLEAVRATTGRTPILYSYPYFWPSAMGGASWFGRYPLWLATYRSTPPAPLSGWSAWTLWQYTSSASVPGVPGGAVDRSHFSGTAAQLAALADGTHATAFPVRAPSAPQRVRATPADHAARVAWQPADDGGHVATGFAVTASPGGQVTAVPGTNSSVTITGLHPGTAYSFTVRATNPAGTSPVSSASAPVAPGQVPARVGSLTATAASGQVRLAWAPAAGAPSSYRVLRCSPAPCTPTAVVATSPASPTSFTDSGRTNGLAYSYAVVATNSWGAGARSAVASAMPVGPPPAPTAVTATASSSTLTITWKPPVTTGGSAVTRYAVRLDGAAPTLLSAAARSWTATGLAAGTAHTVGVAAVNALGTGAATAVHVSTTLPPGSPVGTHLALTLPVPQLPGAATTVTVLATRTDTGAALAGRVVTLLLTPRSGAAPVTVQARTGPNGTATAVLRPGTNSTLTASLARTSSSLTTTTTALLLVRPALAVRPLTGTARRGAATTLAGSTNRAFAGDQVLRQQLYGGAWHTLATTVVGASGTFGFSLVPTTTGPHYYRLVVPATSLHTAAISSRITLQVSA